MRIASLPALVALSSLAAFSARASSATACGALPPPYVTLGSALPASGATDVSPDSVILLEAQGWYAGTPVDARFLFDDVVQVELRPQGAGSDAVAVAGSVHSFGYRAVFVPTAPLAPNTTYALTATVANTADSANGDGSPTTSTSSFTTTSTGLPPLSFGGVPTITFADLDHETCDAATLDSCGRCGTTIVKRARTVVVDLPAPQGGDPIGGFLYRASVSRPNEGEGDRPFTGAETSTPTRVASRATIPLLADVTPDEICVDIVLTDARGTSVSSERQCFSKELVWNAATPLGAGGTNGGGDVADDPASGSDSSCAVARPNRQKGLGSFALLGLLAGAFGLRRTRRRTAG